MGGGQISSYSCKISIVMVVRPLKSSYWMSDFRSRFEELFIIGSMSAESVRTESIVYYEQQKGESKATKLVVAGSCMMDITYIESIVV